jgi:CO dehydrogenase maturation factor
MKLSVCGKGGSGKSTVVALLAGEMAARGRRVLVVDSDESNSGLYRLLGFDRPPVPMMDIFGGKKEIKKRMGQPGLFSDERLQLEEIPEQNMINKDGISLVSIGKIMQPMEGCACPLGYLAKELLKKLDLKPDEVVIADTEAGVEHFGRGVESSVDSVLMVVDPSFDSLELAGRITRMSKELGIGSIGAVLNKVPSSDVAGLLTSELGKRGVIILGTIHNDPDMSMSSLRGNGLGGSRAAEEIKGVVGILLSQNHTNTADNQIPHP